MILKIISANLDTKKNISFKPFTSLREHSVIRWRHADKNNILQLGL